MRYGRLYNIPFQNVTVSAAQDLWEVLMPSDAIGILHRVTVSQTSDAGDAEDEMLRTRIFRVDSPGSSGSGGSSAGAPQPFNFNDAAAGITAEINNTTQFDFLSGTADLLYTRGWNIRQGLDVWFAPGNRPSFTPSSYCLVTLDTAPADALTMHGALWVEEIR